MHSVPPSPDIDANRSCGAPPQPFTPTIALTATHVTPGTETVLDLAIESTTQGFWDFNVETGEANVSRGYARMLGYEPEGFVENYSAWLERIHPEDRERVTFVYGEYLAGRRPIYSVEFRLRTATGGWKWIQSNGEIVTRNQTGRPLRMIGTHTDVSTLMETQASLQKSKQQLQHAMQIARMGNWSWEPKTKAVWWSEEISQMFGVDHKKFVPTLEVYLSLVHPHDREHVDAAVAAILQVGETMEYDARIVRPDGNVVWIHSVAVASRDAEGRLILLEGTDQDITQRKNAELALLDSERRFRTFVEHATDAFFLHEEGGVILDVNQQACQALGYTRDELIGCPISRLDPFIDQQAVVAVDQRLASGESVAFESRHQRKDGSDFPVEVRLRPFFVNGRRYSVGLARDITARRRLEKQEARRVDKLKRLSELNLQLAGEPESVFAQMIHVIGDVFQVPVVCISEIDGPDLILRYAYIRGEVYENLGRCPLEITPCASVVTSSHVKIFDRVAERFPSATFLRDHNAFSYCGFPAINAEGHVVAVICLLDDGPHEFTEEDQHILRIFGQRLAAELDRGRELAIRREFKDKLLASEERFRTLFEAAPVPIFLNDLDGKFRAANSAFKSITGFSDGELIGRTSNEVGLLSPHLPGIVQQLADSGRADGQLVTNTKSGGQWTCQYTTRSVTLNGESLLLTVAVDMSDRIRTEASLRDLRDRYELVIEGSSEGIWEINLATGETFFSDRLLQMFGIARGDWKGYDQWLDSVHPDDRERLTKSLQRHLQQNTPYDIRFRQQVRSGEYRWFHTRGQARRNADGTAICVAGSASDITEQVESENALLESLQRLAEAQRIAYIGDWVWDLPSDSITWSDEVYRIFGHEPQSFVPRYEVEFLQAIHPDDREAVAEAVASSLDSGTPYQVDHRIVFPDGSERTVRERGEVRYDAAGLPIRMIGTVQDITESTRALEQTETLRSELAHVARLGMLGEMVAGIAHELNQPLAAIANNAFTVRRTLEKLPRTASGTLLDNALSFTREIETQSVRGGDIIRRLMTLLRKTGSHRSTVSLRKLIDEVLFLLATEIRLTQVDVDIAVPEDLPEIIVDTVQIQQVLFNVIRNAIQAMTGQSRGRQLRIHAEMKTGRAILVRILDTGPGFSADIEPRIFTPFATTKSDGLGFGLAITKRIVEAHGGEIVIRSKFGDGAEVRFSLPTSGVAGEDVDAR